MIVTVLKGLSRISQHHKEREHYHAYYSIPVFIGFVVTYALIQLLVSLFPDFSFHAEGYHIHHYTYGIILLLIFGYIGIWTRSMRMKYLCALAYGVSAAFIIDEAWMWFTLNAGRGYQDYDLAFFVGALFLSIIIAPLFINGKDKKPLQ